MSSSSLFPGVSQGNAWRWPFQGQLARGSRHGAWGRATEAERSLTRSLLQSAAIARGATAPAGTPSFDPATQNPLEANLGNLIDLRATLVKRTEDASLTIRTAEGDIVTLTSHTELQSLKAKLTYAPGDAPVSPGATRTEDGARGVTHVRLREIQLNQSVTLSVQGELSDQELADIRKLVSSLGDSLKTLGDVDRVHDHEDGERASNPLVRLDTRGLDSLAGFELHVEQSVEVTKIHVRRAPAQLPAPPPSPTDPPGFVPPEAPPVAAEPPIASSPARQPGPGPVKPPVLGRATPIQPNDAGWLVRFTSTRRSTVADILFRRALGAPPPVPGTELPLPESPAARL